MKIISFKREDYCNNCNSNMSIELYDEYNKPVNYSYILNTSKNDGERFNTRSLSHFKCKRCNREYDIQWVNGKPVPLINDMIYTSFLEDVYTKKNKSRR